jgi:hypothetical protein
VSGVRLRVGDVDVASYVVNPDVDARHGPRPYLHPVRTLGGTPVADAAPDDHPWHLGVSVAMQDVAGTNLWGGRTYVRGQGYTWRDDHGIIVHDGFSVATAGGFTERLRWRSPTGADLLTEERWVSAAPAPPHGWELRFAYRLVARAVAVPLGSPATNGRPGGAGYGGFFWRAAPGEHEVFDPSAGGEEAVNGSAAAWLALRGPTYTLVFQGLTGDDRWFVRTGIYPGVCAALAFERPLVVPAGGAVERRLRVLVADGSLSREHVEAYCRHGLSRDGDPRR